MRDFVIYRNIIDHAALLFSSKQPASAFYYICHFSGEDKILSNKYNELHYNAYKF